jgi:hypothetical protein
MMSLTSVPVPAPRGAVLLPDSIGTTYALPPVKATACGSLASSGIDLTTACVATEIT